LGAFAETTNFAVFAASNHTFPLPSIRQKGDETRTLGLDRTVQGPASDGWKLFAAVWVTVTHCPADWEAGASVKAGASVTVKVPDRAKATVVSVTLILYAPPTWAVFDTEKLAVTVPSLLI
jgi:hypothetical protein